MGADCSPRQPSDILQHASHMQHASTCNMLLTSKAVRAVSEKQKEEPAAIQHRAERDLDQRPPSLQGFTPPDLQRGQGCPVEALPALPPGPKLCSISPLSSELFYSRGSDLCGVHSDLAGQQAQNK